MTLNYEFFQSKFCLIWQDYQNNVFFALMLTK